MYYAKRIRLRRVDPIRDLDDRYRWMNDPSVVKYLGMRPQRLSRDEIKKFLETVATTTTEMVEFAIETLDARHIGGTQLRKFDHIARSAEFAIVIGEAEYRGKGYGTEVARQMVEVGFSGFNLHRIWLTLNEENVGAERAYDKAGFSREGVMRDAGFANGKYYNSIVMSILRHEWESGKGRA